MSVPVSPKFPTILKDLVDKSKRVPDIDLSNVGGGYPIKHITLESNSLQLIENTYLVIDNPLDKVMFLINPFDDKKSVICEVVINHEMLLNSSLAFGAGRVYKNVIVTIDGVETTMKYEIPAMIYGMSIYFNEELEEPIKHIYYGYENNPTYQGESNFVLKEVNDVFIVDIMGFVFSIGTSFKLTKDGDVYKGTLSIMGQEAHIIHTKPIIEFGDIVSIDLMGETNLSQVFYYKKPDSTKANEYIVEFSADSVEISEELIFNNNTPPAVSKSGRTVLSIVNGICAYLNVE